MYTDVLMTNLKISIDWLAFTIKDESMDVESVIDFFGLDGSMFTVSPRGANGYKSMINLDGYGLSILSDGSINMGIHVNITGSAIGHVLSCYLDKNSVPNPFNSDTAFCVDDFDQTILVKFFNDICKIGKIVRLDIAIDDMGKNVHFTLDDILFYLEQDLVISKFRNYTNNITKKISCNELVGGTIYFGSSQSDVRLRIYDKQLEYNSKNPQSLIDTPWVRWEFQLRNERAMSAVNLLLMGNTLGQVASGILNNYIRFIINDNNNRSRCSVDPKWLDFIGSLDKVQLSVKSVPKTLQDKKNWVISQVLPTLTGIIIADGGTFDIIMDNWDTSIMRMKHDMISLIHC